jgi:membrane protein implicated in regulation of membrane protease activity
MTVTQFWVVIMVIAAIGELLTLAFYSIWFVAGAFLALVAKWLGISFTGQFYVFLISSAILILMSEFLLKRKLGIIKTPHKTNIDSIIGKEAIVTEKINNTDGTGEVEIAGKKWTAVSIDDSVIPLKEKVVIEKVDGVKLIVRKKNAL